MGGGSGDESSSEDESVPVASLVAAALRQPAKRPHPGKPADATKPTGVADTAATTPAPAAKPLPAPARPVDAAKPTKEPTAAAAKPGARAKSKSSSAGGASRKRQARGGTTQRQAPLSDLEQELQNTKDSAANALHEKEEKLAAVEAAKATAAEAAAAKEAEAR